MKPYCVECPQMFAALAIMPWLPAGSRYYADLNAKAANQQNSEATPENLV